MPRYRMMTPENAALVARYLLSLTPVNRAIPASMCAAADGGAADASADR
jgi:Na+/citrate or Na+/malate symporter